MLKSKLKNPSRNIVIRRRVVTNKKLLHSNPKSLTTHTKVVYKFQTIVSNAVGKGFIFRLLVEEASTKFPPRKRRPQKHRPTIDKICTSQLESCDTKALCMVVVQFGVTRFKLASYYIFNHNNACDIYVLKSNSGKTIEFHKQLQFFLCYFRSVWKIESGRMNTLSLFSQIFCVFGKILATIVFTCTKLL